MPLDGIVLRAVANELNSNIINGRIEKVLQSTKDDVYLHIYNNGQKYQLVISANAAYPRIHFTDLSVENPETPFNFCILLRKHLVRSKISNIYQPGLERIIEIKFEGINEIGDPSTRFLVVEIMGKHSNIILLNENKKIIDSIKHIDIEVSRLREILPGRDYCYPNTQEKLELTEADITEKIPQIFSIQDKKLLQKNIVDSFYGISPFASRSIINEIFNHGDKNPTENALDAFSILKENIIKNSIKPYICYNENHAPVDFHCFFSEQFDTDSVKYFTSINKVLNTYYSTKTIQNKISHKKGNLLSSVNNKLEKCNKKIKIQNQNLEESAEMETLRLYGELLISNLYRIKPGMEEIIVNNYYSEDNEEIKIPLNPNISPSLNAQNFYKKYVKAKKTAEAANSLLSSLKDYAYYLESLVYEIEACESEHELSEIRSELISEGIINEFVKPKKNPPTSSPYEFLSSDGFRIYSGRNNQQNDKLTMKSSSKSDVWFHTRNIPGSHVIIKTEKRDVPESTLYEAALIASYFSKAKESSNVAVDYTFIKHVKKPSNAKPGFVIYENFKTIVVTPDKGTVERLRIFNPLP